MDAVHALDDSCTAEDDCVVIENVEECEGVPSLAGCGVSVNKEVYAAHRAELDAIADGFGDCTCEEVFCVADCGGLYPQCSNGHCSYGQNGLCHQS